MYLKNKESNFLLVLFAILPLCIILGSSVSLLCVVILNLIILFILLSEKNYEFVFKTVNKSLIILGIYLIFNTIISIDPMIGLGRNVGFFRFLFLFIAINYLVYKNPKSLKLIFLIWSILFSLVVIDVYIEFFFGSNIFGWGALEINGVPQPNGERIVSFFKDEPIAGAFLSAFVMVLSGFYLENFKTHKFKILLFLIISFLAILLTGERSNTIKILFCLILLLIFVDFFKLREKFLIIFTLFIVLTFTYSNSDYLKNRYYYVKQMTTSDGFSKFKEQSLYYKLYKSGYSVFKNNYLFGVGNKNYRVVTCQNKKNIDDYICLTHPHQTYIEFLSEHGIIGTLILLGIFFLLIFKILKQIIISRNYIQLGSFLFILTNFIPILPSGSFFTDFNSTLFWLNFGIMFACTKETNVFHKP